MSTLPRIILPVLESSTSTGSDLARTDESLGLHEVLQFGDGIDDEDGYDEDMEDDAVDSIVPAASGARVERRLRLRVPLHHHEEPPRIVERVPVGAREPSEIDELLTIEASPDFTTEVTFPAADKKADPLLSGAMVFLGAFSEVESLLAPFDKLETILKVILGQNPFLAVTRRGVLRPLISLGLTDYDFSGKAVLDVGSARNRLAQLVNLVYGRTGAVAHALDKMVTPKGKHGIKGDAMAMPYSEDSFDLVTSNRLLEHYYLTEEAYQIIDEMIRVCRPGGEIRFSLEKSMNLSKLIDGLEGHPALESIAVIQSGLAGTQYVKLKLSETKPSAASLEAYKTALEDTFIRAPWYPLSYTAYKAETWLTQPAPQRARLLLSWLSNAKFREYFRLNRPQYRALRDEITSETFGDEAQVEEMEALLESDRQLEVQDFQFRLMIDRV